MRGIPINEAKVAFDRMYHFTAIAPEQEEGVSINDINSISLQNISFRFAGRKPILQYLSLQIKKGEIVKMAVVRVRSLTYIALLYARRRRDYC